VTGCAPKSSVLCSSVACGGQKASVAVQARLRSTNWKPTEPIVLV
jgi:hypothetical protein